MKKIKLFSLFGLGILFTFGLLLGGVKNTAPVMLRAEGEETSEPAPVDDPVDDEPVEPVDNPVDESETFECSVVLNTPTHGSLKADKLEGHVGDVVTLNADADIFYVIKYVTVNGTALVEDEDIRGKFTFSLIEGENKIVAKFVIDEELLGELSGIVDQAMNKDWTNLFTLENLLRLISWIFSGSVIFVLTRHYIKDKKLGDRVEKGASETIKKILPDDVKAIVMKAIEDFFKPLFVQFQTSNEETQEAIVVLTRCFALAQDGTPESKIAITKELASMKLSDKASISIIEEKLNNFIEQQKAQQADVMNKIANMQAKNEQIINESKAEEKAEDPVDDNGIQIE